jgi:hypothetical protein
VTELTERRRDVERRAAFAMLMAIAMVCSLGIATTASAEQPGGTGKHYELNIAAFANCTMTTADGTYPDCFNGNTGPGGHVIFIPVKTAQEEDLCQDGTILTEPITNAQLFKGVRILVTDGPKLEVLDKDATDGTARFQIPNGCYDIYTAAAGKPGGCADIDTLICCTDVLDCVDTQVACDPNLANNTAYALVGHIDVDRNPAGGKPQWDKVDDELLGVGDWLVQQDGYFAFFWQIFNQYVRVIKMRIVEVDCPA